MQYGIGVYESQCGLRLNHTSQLNVTYMHNHVMIVLGPNRSRCSITADCLGTHFPFAPWWWEFRNYCMYLLHYGVVLCHASQLYVSYMHLNICV